MRRSRLFDAVVWIPRPPAAAWAPNLDARTFAPAVRWAEQVLATALEFNSDAILMSTDDEQFILSQFADLFANEGVVLLCPPHHAIAALNDKLHLADAARDLGIDVPLTIRADRFVGSPQTLAKMPGKVILKRRLSQGASGAQVFPSALLAADHVASNIDGSEQAEWVVQQYVVGSAEPSMTVWMDCAGEATVALSHVKHRFLTAGASTAVEIVKDFVDSSLVVELLRSAGHVGPSGVQFKIADDGKAWLLEVNTRMGQNTRHVLAALAASGVNPGRLLVDQFSSPQRQYEIAPSGRAIVSPLDDILSFYTLHRMKRESDPSSTDTPYLRHFVEILQSYRPPPVPETTFTQLWKEPQVVIPLYARWIGVIRSSPSRFVPRQSAGALSELRRGGG